jgi:hypothetical protein
MGAPVQARDQYLDLVRKPLTDVPWEDRFRAVQLELNVEVSPRYKPDQALDKGEAILQPGTTWCNVYVTDFVRLMGVQAPTHWVTKDGAPATVGKGTELRANGLLDWFGKHGARYGWASADAAAAQNAAQRGHLVVVGWKNPKPPRPGHVAIVLGADRISQAGAHNHFVCTVRMGFGDVSPLVWYVQMDRPGGHTDV